MGQRVKTLESGLENDFVFRGQHKAEAAQVRDETQVNPSSYGFEVHLQSLNRRFQKLYRGVIGHMRGFLALIFIYLKVFIYIPLWT